jgi:hypothetical protein
MNPDEFKQAWQTQTSQARLTIAAELLLKEVQRNQWHLTIAIFWRDVREVGMAILMAPLWIYLGVKLSLPWTWYLTVPALAWIAGFMLVDRMRHKRQPPEPGEPLRRGVESSLAQVEHQIWLLRNVLWWYLLPLALPMLAFLGQVAFGARSSGWLGALVVAPMVIVVAVVFTGVYWLNQKAVGSALEPRRQELEGLLTSLKDETPATRC